MKQKKVIDISCAILLPWLLLIPAFFFVVLGAARLDWLYRVVGVCVFLSSCVALFFLFLELQARRKRRATDKK
jgi:predicted permease